MNGLTYQCLLFLGSLILMSVSSFVLTVALERIGATANLSGGLVGLLTALSADTPEIASSIMAISAGHHELGISVVLGSNIFNLAILLGVSALVTGIVKVGKAGALLNGGASLLSLTVIGLLLVKRMALGWTLFLLILIVVPYICVLSLNPGFVPRLPVPKSIADFLGRAVNESTKRSKQENADVPQTIRRATLADWLSLAPALFAIVAGSRGTVNSTVFLSAKFSIPNAIAGTLGIAALTGIPNAVAAFRLAVRGRGSAVQTECFNSNTLNLSFGICLPALVVGLGPISSRAFFTLIWLLGMTALAIFLLYRRGGLHRMGGIMLMTAYLVFAIIVVFWPNLTSYLGV